MISFAEVARILPKRRAGRPVSISTVYRWALAGFRGIKLQWVQVGSTKCTTREFLAEFFDRLTVAEGGIPKTRTHAQRQREIAAAEDELKRAGI